MDFQDRVVEFPNRHKLKLVEGTTDTYDLEAIEGAIGQQGTPLNAVNMNTLAPKDSPEFTGTPKKNGVNIATVEDTVAAAEKLVTNEPKVVEDVISGSRITATNDVEIIDSQPSVKTAEIQSIKGCTIKAIQKNGNFANGTAGWIANIVTATTANGVATLTVTTPDFFSGFLGDATQTQSIAGHKYYLSVWIKAKYANIVKIGFANRSVAVPATANQWVLISGIVTPPESGDSPFSFHDTSTQYVSGDTFEIKDFRVIDLTESDQSLQNMTKEQLDEKLSTLPYFEGIRHTNVRKLVSTGDNLWDYKYFYDTLKYL